MNSVHISNLGQELTPIQGGFSQDTVSTTAQEISAIADISPNTVDYVDITIEGGDLRYRADGIAPTPTTGRILYDKATYRLAKFEASKAQVIRDSETAVDVTVQTQTMNRPGTL